VGVPDARDREAATISLMTQRTVQEPGERPPRRLLDQAPSERLAARTASAGSVGRSVDAGAGTAAGSRGRAVAWGLAAGTGAAAVHLAVATVLLWTGALLVVAVVLGIVVGLAVAAGGGSSLAPTARRSLAVALALTALGVAIGVNWALSGMYLGPLDYLAQVYGLLVPAQAALAAFGAVAGSR
jgi:hypothetical protein